MRIARLASRSALAALLGRLVRVPSVRAWLVGVAVVGALAASSAAAQAVDTVLLPGGGRIRGTVEVYEPNRQVVVLLPDGTRRRLRRGEFESVIFGDATSSPSAPPEPTAPDASAPPAGPPPEVAPPAAPPAAEVAPSQPPPSQPPPSPPAPTEPPSAQTPGAVLEPMGPGADAPSITPDAQQRLEGAMPTIEPVAPAVAPAVAFGDGRADGAWPEDDPNRVPRPVGMVHVGVQLLGTLQISAGLQYVYVPSSPLYLQNLTFGGELSGYADLRLALPFHLRGALVVAGFGDAGGVRRQYDYGSSDPSLQGTTLYGRGVLELGARVLFGFLLSDGFALRIGGQAGMEWLSTVARAEGYGDGVLELAARLLDSRFEIIAQTALGVRAVGYESYTASDTRFGTSSGFSARVSLGVGYVVY